MDGMLATSALLGGANLPNMKGCGSYSRWPHGGAMWHHFKKLMYTVRVDTPDPSFGDMLLEQLGGANGKLAAAIQYSTKAQLQGFR